MIEEKELEDIEESVDTDLEADAELETEDTENESEEENSVDNQADNADDSGESGEEEEQVDIVRERGDSQTAQGNSRNAKHRRKLNALKGENVNLKEGLSEKDKELERVKEENRLLKLAEEVKAGNDAPKEPNPEDFDSVYDPEFQKAQREYNQFFIEKEVDRKVGEITSKGSEQVNQSVKSEALERKQLAYIDCAEKLGAKDFDKSEKRVLKMFGADTLNHIINSLKPKDVAHVVYYLGKERNSEEAEEVAELMKTNAIAGLVEIGSIRSEIKLTKTKTKKTKDPDEQLDGFVSSKRIKGDTGVYDPLKGAKLHKVS